jgi:hypothetical protein
MAHSPKIGEIQTATLCGAGLPPLRAEISATLAIKTVAQDRVVAASEERAQKRSRGCGEAERSSLQAPGMPGTSAAGPGMNTHLLNRDTMCRPIALFAKDVMSRAYAAEMRPILSEDGAFVANRFDSILSRRSF